MNNIDNNNNNDNHPLAFFSVEMLQGIFSYLNFEEAHNCSQVCKLFYAALKDQPTLYREIVERQWGQAILPKDPDESMPDFVQRCQKTIVYSRARDTLRVWCRLLESYVANGQLGVTSRLTNLRSLEKEMHEHENRPIAVKDMDLIIECASLFQSWLENLPPELKEVTKLSLSGCDLRSVPKEIFILKNLQLLNLNNNTLTTLPKEIGTLEHLAILYLNDNDFKKLPKVIKDLKNLTRLFAERNKLTSIPDFIGNLKELEEVHLSENQLTSLCREIEECKKLRLLVISENNLTPLPEWLLSLKSVNVFSAGQKSPNRN